MPEDSTRGGGEVQRIGAEALGQPGERRFRMLAVIDGETSIVWMEKEQLRRLGQALGQILENLPDRVTDAEPAPVNTPAFDLNAKNQIRAGRMELGYDEQRRRLILLAYSLDDVDGSGPAFICQLSPAQAKQLSGEAASVVAAGRPTCPLCLHPMGPGDHVCAKQNGHFPHRLDEVQDVEDEDDEP